jgi:hypothetical protein
VDDVPDSVESRQMRDALHAIRAKLARMRLESEASLTRLSETRKAADARDEERAQHRDTQP